MSKTNSVSISSIEEYQISATKEKQIASLLTKCFADYPTGKTFLKQVPNFRILALHGKQIVGHIAVDHRYINNGGSEARVFCLSDVCVDPDFQSKKVASRMISYIETVATKHGLDFLLLTALKTNLYYNNGFRVKDNEFKWLVLQDRTSLGLVKRRIPKTVMVKRLSKQIWSKDGLIDLAGPIF